MTATDTEALAKKLDGVLEELCRGADGARCTLRFDDPDRGWHVDYIVAEALTPGVKSLRGDGGIDQRAAATVHWMEKNRRNLVQPDLINAPDPAPPPALMSAYAATAQMLTPLFNAEGHLQGWISVHYVGGVKDLTAAHQAALDAARTKAAALLGLPAQ